jgi:hypothetical protein
MAENWGSTLRSTDARANRGTVKVCVNAAVATWANDGHSAQVVSVVLGPALSSVPTAPTT